MQKNIKNYQGYCPCTGKRCITNHATFRHLQMVPEIKNLT